MTTTIRLPYPGLRAFTRDESDLFFGRDGCIDAMVDRLAATRFLAVLGTSGSGKSSLVRTGLLDALNLGLHPWAGSQWTVADLHPGCQPTRNLAAALLTSQSTASPEAMSVDLLATFLRRGPRSVVEWAAGGNLEAGNLLILVDQFEELFRYGNYARQEEAEAFVGLLLETAAMEGMNIHVVVTMRSEYLGACALMPGLAERINTGLYLTPRMTREECREAIEGPAAVTGFIVERAFVNRLLNDLATFAPWDAGDGADQAERLARRADQLPLMQHVLNRMWARASQEANGTGVVLRLADYEALGGLSGALDGHGNEVLSALGETRARAARMVFESLVTGTAVADAVRRPCQLRELVEISGNRDDVVAIVEAFSAPDCNFLRESGPSTTTDDAIVDISHESLIRQWTPLRQWLTNEVRNGAAWRRLLSAEERYSHSEGGRLTGLDLVSLAAWWEATAPTSAWAKRHGGNFAAVQNFIGTSRQAEAEQAEVRRQREKRERKFLRLGVAGLMVGLVVTLAFSVFAQIQQQQLERKNSELVTESRRASAAESQAREGLEQANRARNQAEEERQRAEDEKERAEEMARVVNEQKNTLTEVTKAVRSNRYNDVRRMLQVRRDERVDTANENLGIAEVSRSDASVPARPAAERSNVNEVVAARRTYVLDPTPVNLDALGAAVERLYDKLLKLRQVREAEAQYEELLIDAEKLVADRPDVATYRAAWIIFINYGDRLKARDRAKAAKAFVRSLELSELLSQSSPDLYRRLVSYERVGDEELADGNVEFAAVWFQKETDLARRRYTLEKTADNLSTLRLAAERLYQAQVKLNSRSDGDAVLRELVATAEQLVELTPDSPSYRVAWSILIAHGDAVKVRDGAAARKSFGRSVEMADMLSYGADDLHRRMVSYERVGDLQSADGKVDVANTWYTKEVQAARAKYTSEATAESLGSLKIGINRLSGTLTRLKRQVEANALQKELTDAAETLVKKTPGPAAYDVAWDILTDQGDRLKPTDRAEARRAFARSVEMVERLPEDNAADLFKRVYSYNRLGELDLGDGHHEPAAEWFTKAVAANRKRYRLEPTTANLASLQRTANRLVEAHAKLNRQTEDDALQQELVGAAENLLARSSSQDTAHEVIQAYTEAADQAWRSGDRVKAQRHLARAEAWSQKLVTDTADAVYSRYQSFDFIADSHLTQGSATEARAAYLQSGTALEHYLLAFRTASPPRVAADDSVSVASQFGNLSFTYLRAGNFSKSIEAARHGLDLEPNADWIEANMAHGLLLTGKDEEAVKCYMKIRKGTLNERSILTVTAEDFTILKSLGFEHLLMDTILKQMQQE